MFRHDAFAVLLSELNSRIKFSKVEVWRMDWDKVILTQ